MMRRCACILLVEFQKLFQCSWDRDCTNDVRAIDNLDKSPQNIEREVKYMISCGSRYINLETSLGPGSSLLLGLDIAESM